MTILLIFLKSLLPHTNGEKVLFGMDISGVLMSILSYTVLDVTELLTFYIAFMTGVSITISVVVKLYNLFTSNQKNKKI